MWLASPVTHFLTGVSQCTSPNFSKDWCVREFVKHSRTWASCVFFFVHEFVAKTQNPFLGCPFEEFTMPSLKGFMDKGKEYGEFSQT